MVIHGKNGSPHSGHGMPGRKAPGIYPQLRQIEEEISSITGPLQTVSSFIIHEVDADAKWSALCSAYSGDWRGTGDERVPTSAPREGFWQNTED